MRAPNLQLVAAVALVAGVAGCSLPEVRPLVGVTTAGPSPYGIWYEQHWATNAVLLAAADEPEAPAAEETANQAPVAASEISASEMAVSTSEETSQMSYDPSREAAEASREAADAARASREAAEAFEGIDGAAEALPAVKSQPQVPAPSSGPVRY